MAGKRFVLMILLLAGSILVLSAQTGNVVEQLRNRGYTVENPRTEDGRPTWDLVHDEQVPFTLGMIGSFTEARAEALQVVRDVVFGLEGLDARRIRVVFDRNRAAVVVFPRAYLINGRDYSGYMPSGMQFSYDDSLFYDFRMLAEDLALRVNGQFLTEEQFNERITRAIDNPQAYIESADPLFLSRRLEEHQELIDNTRATDIRQDGNITDLNESITELNRADREILEQIDEYVTLGEQALTREVRRGERALRDLRSDLDHDLAELTARHERLVQAHEQLLSDYESLLDTTRNLIAEFEAHREGAIALTGRRLFGSLREIHPDAIAQVVALRRADPTLEADEARDRVNEQLPEDTAQLHSRHVQAIYAFYFNDYR